MRSGRRSGCSPADATLPQIGTLVATYCRLLRALGRQMLVGGIPVMSAWRMIVVSTALVSVIAVSGCGPKQPEGQYGDRGQCFQQAACTGSSLLQDAPP